MKTKFLIALFFLGFTIANAQVTLKPGVKAGLNISRFTNTEGSNKSDFYIGGLLAIKLAKFYTLQPELVYSRQGANVKTYSDFTNPDPIVYGSKTEKYSLNYLSLGVINKFTFGPGFQVVVGPSIDFKVGDNFEGYASDDLIGLDLAFIAGLGFEFKNGITVEARFKQGMADIFGNNYNEYNDSNNNGNYDEVILNQLFQLGVSYSFDLK